MHLHAESIHSADVCAGIRHQGLMVDAHVHVTSAAICADMSPFARIVRNLEQESEDQPVYSADVHARMRHQSLMHMACASDQAVGKRIPFV